MMTLAELEMTLRAEANMQDPAQRMMVQAIYSVATRGSILDSRLIEQQTPAQLRSLIQRGARAVGAGSQRDAERWIRQNI